MARLGRVALGGVAAVMAAGAGWALEAPGAPHARGGRTTAVAAPVLINHPENVQLGLANSRPQLTLTNPRGGDPRAIEEGKQLFISYNCADCHGSDGSGDVAPSFDDGRWHFGGTVGDVYESIEEGRPDGMPAWGGRISESQVWALVAYVRTLGAGADVSTENFEGATVQRGGH
jgi:cytochrome c oxidase cbb3-type subunit III